MGVINRSTGGLWSRKKQDVAATTTVDIDSIDYETFRHAKYIITAWNKTQDKAKTMEMTVLRENDDVNDTISNKIGTGINWSVNAVKSGSKVNISFENKESFSVKVEFAKIIVGKE